MSAWPRNKSVAGAGPVSLFPEQEAFWQRFCRATGHQGWPIDCDMFGTPQMADELLDLVLKGRKRATCTHARWVARGDMPMPFPGAFSIITDAFEMPACVIRTESVTIKPFNEAMPAFAWREGEGNRMLYDWKRAHRNYFNGEARRYGFVFRESDLCIVEEFEMIWQPV